MKKILIIFGTRPEAIKMSPLVHCFKKQSSFEVKVCVSAQHREMLDSVLDIFEIKPDYDLDIMKPHQNLFDITINILNGIKRVLEDYKPDIVFVHGDTTTAMSASLAALYTKTKIAHIEAGLRTYDLASPFPEEANRQIVDVLSDYYFVPTLEAKENLMLERKKESAICVSGNTIVDSLLFILQSIENNKSLYQRIADNLSREYPYYQTRRFILVTGHRRENFGQGFQNICEALLRIAQNNPDVDIVYSIHPNPNVQQVVRSMLADRKNIFLIPPLNYENFVYLMSKSYFIMTDSGGIQEEAPTLKKPILLMRNNTERPEALKTGIVKLVGTEVEKICSEAQNLLDSYEAVKAMEKIQNPYGDGRACEKIVEFIKSINQEGI
ncbi:MAG: UDP-N-acetylglucosamine 2-epimerase (non-hydrolyzing) [Helicobacter sp.]|nr:UDP-N-acetylglucosamine 2-epimerase (non-hydrolyzing) [Helicobacter sp.]